MKRGVLLLIFIVAFLLDASAQQFTLSGTISGITNQLIFLYKDTGDRLVKMDSTIIDNGKFRFKGNCKQPFVAQLRVAKNKRCRFFISPTNMQLNIDANKIAYGFLLKQLVGSPAHDRFVAYQKQIQENRKKQRKVQRDLQLPEVKNNPDNKELFTERLNKLKRFKDDYYYRYAVSPVISYLIYQEYFVKKRDIDFLEKKLEFLNMANPNGMYVKNMRKRVKILKLLKNKGVFPDINSRTLGGDYFRLKQLRGKPVLVYIWRAWNEKNNKKYYDAIFAIHKKYPNLNIVNVIRNSSFNVELVDNTKQLKRRELSPTGLPNCIDIESVDKKLELTQYIDKHVNAFLLNKEGKILFHKNKFTTAELLAAIAEYQKK